MSFTLLNLVSVLKLLPPFLCSIIRLNNVYVHEVILYNVAELSGAHNSGVLSAPKERSFNNSHSSLFCALIMEQIPITLIDFSFLFASLFSVSKVHCECYCVTFKSIRLTPHTRLHVSWSPERRRRDMQTCSASGAW